MILEDCFVILSYVPE